jgi:hypothetical protein
MYMASPPMGGYFNGLVVFINTRPANNAWSFSLLLAAFIALKKIAAAIPSGDLTGV